MLLLCHPDDAAAGVLSGTHSDVHQVPAEFPLCFRCSHFPQDQFGDGSVVVVLIDHAQFLCGIAAVLQ